MRQKVHLELCLETRPTSVWHCVRVRPFFGVAWAGTVTCPTSVGLAHSVRACIRKIVNRSQWFSVSLARNASRLHATHHSHNPWQLPHSIIHLNLRHARNSCPGRVSRRSARHQPYPPLNEAFKKRRYVGVPETTIDANIAVAALETFGLRTVKPQQLAAIRACLLEKDALITLPTGYEKSLCFQLIPALTGGTAIMICFLLALAADQVTPPVHILYSSPLYSDNNPTAHCQPDCRTENSGFSGRNVPRAQASRNEK